MQDRDCGATLTTEEAARIMRACRIPTEAVTLRDGLEQRAYPFGTCVVRGTRVFQIYKKPFAEWIEKQTGIVLNFSPVIPDAEALAELVK